MYSQPTHMMPPNNIMVTMNCNASPSIVTVKLAMASVDRVSI